MVYSRPHSQVETIGPAVAADYLSSNTINRKISPAIVAKYAGMMARGEWELTHQGIAFNAEGDLIDGQHRLTAIIKSGAHIPMMVTRNLPVQAYYAVDQLRVRSIADNTGMGVREIQTASALCRMYFGTNTSQEQVLMMRTALLGEIRAVTDSVRQCKAVLSAAPIRAGVVMVLAYDPGKWAWTISQYIAFVGDGKGARAPKVAAFRDQLYSSRPRRIRGGGELSLDRMVRAFMAFSYDRREDTRVFIKDVSFVAGIIKEIITKRLNAKTPPAITAPAPQAATTPFPDDPRSCRPVPSASC